jgi:hypothetical protein
VNVLLLTINSRDSDFHFQVKHYWCSATDSTSIVSYNARGFVQRNNSTGNNSNASTGTIAQLFKQCTHTIIKAHSGSSSSSSSISSISSSDNSSATTMTQAFSNYMDDMLHTLSTAKVYHVR